MYCIDTAIHDLVFGSCNGEIDVELNVPIRIHRGEDETCGTLPVVLVQVTGLLRYTHAQLDHQKSSIFWKIASRKEGAKE